MEHFQLLFAVAVVLQGRVVQEQVEGERVRQHGTFGVAAIEHGLAEAAQLLHGAGAGAAGRLVGAHHHPTQGPPGRQGRQGQGHQDRGAVGVSDDPLVGKGRLGVHLWHHQGHLGIEAKGAGVVDHQGTGRGRHGGPLLGHRTAGRGQHQINPRKGLGTHGLDRPGAAIPGQGLAGRAGGRQQHQLRHRELALGQQGEQFLAHGPGGTEHGHLEGPVGEGTGGREGQGRKRRKETVGAKGLGLVSRLGVDQEGLRI